MLEAKFILKKLFCLIRLYNYTIIISTSIYDNTDILKKRELQWYSQII